MVMMMGSDESFDEKDEDPILITEAQIGMEEGMLSPVKNIEKHTPNIMQQTLRMQLDR